MEDFKVVCENLDDFIDEELHAKVMQALEKACLIIERDAKKACPTGDGQLRQSITHSVDEKELYAIVGTNVDYAPYVEIGTGIYSTEETGRTTPWCYQNEKTGEWHWTRGMHPKPFLQPAMEANKDKILKCFKGII